jgi:hypothetical protein
MFTFFRDIATDQDITLSSVYGMKVQPDPRYKKKLEKAIEKLGDRYVLHKSVGKATK